MPGRKGCASFREQTCSILSKAVSENPMRATGRRTPRAETAPAENLSVQPNVPTHLTQKGGGWLDGKCPFFHDRGKNNNEARSGGKAPQPANHGQKEQRECGVDQIEAAQRKSFDDFHRHGAERGHRKKQRKRRVRTKKRVPAFRVEAVGKKPVEHGHRNEGKGQQPPRSGNKPDFPASFQLPSPGGREPGPEPASPPFSIGRRRPRPEAFPLERLRSAKAPFKG